MTNQSSIRYISSLLSNPHSVTEGDYGSIASLVQTYPYFVPARYLTALQRHKKWPFAPDMLTATAPYMGNWILFCDFLETGLFGRDHEPTASQSGSDGYVAEPEQTTEPAANEAFYKEEEPIATAEPAFINPDADNYTFIDAKDDFPLFDILTTDNSASVEDAEDNSSTYVEETTGDSGQGEAIGDNFVYNEIAESNPKDDNLRSDSSSDNAAIIEAAEGNSALFAPDEAILMGGTESDIVEIISENEEEPLIIPVYTNDYFIQNGTRIPDDIPAEIDELKITPDKSSIAEAAPDEEEDKSLMVMMSFSEWLMHFKDTANKQQEENKEQKALKTMWQKEKLAAAMEEENEEIPENVFEMAVNSITQEEGLVSETLADIYIKQGKYDKAIEMYRKLSLRNPQKSTYFARKIEEVLKDKQS